MNEQEYIEQEQEKHNKRLLAQLDRIAKYGYLRSKYQTDTLLINGLIQFSSPRNGFPYNHYRLTDKGMEMLCLTGITNEAYEALIHAGEELLLDEWVDASIN